MPSTCRAPRAARFALHCCFLLLLALFFGTAHAQAATCSGVLPPGNGEDLVVTGTCVVMGSGMPYHYGKVNIAGSAAAPAKLVFMDQKIDFWASSIIVENFGSLVAGSPMAPIGAMGGSLTIHLYGADQKAGGKGATCMLPNCGVPQNIWDSNGAAAVKLDNGVTDYFYQYKPFDVDNGDPLGYYGYKVLAVGYGGTMQLFGAKGTVPPASPGPAVLPPNDSGLSWGRLCGTLNVGDETLIVDRRLDMRWRSGDMDSIVVTTTDYLPGHSEQFGVVSVTQTTCNGKAASQITLDHPAVYNHNGKAFDLSRLPDDIGPDPGTANRTAETRAAVALLTRHIRIVSAGDAYGVDFPKEPTDGSDGYYFGGHTVFRQGFQAVQVSGVEFYQLGQGGRIMHYPVHFHLARQTPQGLDAGNGLPRTMIADSVVNESMTRWYTIHGTSGVNLFRNIGYKSIGHGFYLEDGTETENKLYSNLGIFARAAVKNDQNKRHVPGILAANRNGDAGDSVPFYTDVDHPTDFWITNAWNDFQGNMAAGAGSCGMCYWLVPAFISGPSAGQKWAGYAGEQNGPARASSAPLMNFQNNSCSSAMNSFITVGLTAPCQGLFPNGTSPVLEPVPNPLAPGRGAGGYYPNVLAGGGHFPTVCNTADCSDNATVPVCDSDHQASCTTTVLDHYTSSFTWADTNIGAIWLRPQWYVVSNSVITDVQNGGLTFVTGGGYSHADEIYGHWAIARNNAFVGSTQAMTDNPFTSNGGPFNPKTASQISCELQTDGKPAAAFCLSKPEGVSFPRSNFANNQRLFNIYDGPAYQESNGYLDITTTTLDDCTPNANGSPCNSQWMYASSVGVPRDLRNPNSEHPCYLPNAAIGWKQPNGFYYPPAFHSNNLFFDNVDIRHFVIEPLSGADFSGQYCTWSSRMFGSDWTDVDRQTELNDDDGSLTGLKQTISVNEDPFFRAPNETQECLSGLGVLPGGSEPGTAKTSPYDYVTTVEFPACQVNNICNGSWQLDCTQSSCFGLPLYRQDLTAADNGSAAQIKMAGQKTGQRSTLTVNHGTYLIDTTLTGTEQGGFGDNNGANVFLANNVYYTFLIYAKPTTVQTYQLYVGGETAKDFNVDTMVDLTRVDVGPSPPHFKQESQSPIWSSAAGHWHKSYDATTGILTVTMDMSAGDFPTEYAKEKTNLCQPAGYCAADSSSPNGCGCSANYAGDPLEKKNCQAICSKWAGNDPPCPDGGCYGIAVTLPPSFMAGNHVRPKAQCFPQSDTYWSTPFEQFVPVQGTDACQYTSDNLPKPDFSCTNPPRRR